MPWGVLYTNAANPTHHQSNQGHVTASLYTPDASDILVEAFKQTEGHYQAHSIVPRLVTYGPLDPHGKASGVAGAHGWTGHLEEDLVLLQHDPSGTLNLSPREVRVRSATLADMPRCAAVFARAFGYDTRGDTAWIEPKLTAQLHRPSIFTLVIGELDSSALPGKVDDTAPVLAGVSVAYHPDVVTTAGKAVRLIQSLAVDPAYQRRGVGGALLDYLCRPSPGVESEVFIETTVDEARRLYLNHGFIEAGVVTLHEFWKP
ncbi:hypothetical protein IWQ60_003398 [Tieghemiomyces parasiticus]|uniref:N-acetyltransferase domain-containing protein n=1 Tax=Tieghemiomyces parasiticus TaxID=78921 RepID=A0A9W8DWH8_9FUNG|nr:hypothetical protein IWQ60_003398 [Tieghemiomyces parasiticus]